MLATLERVGVVDRMDDSADYRIGIGIAELAGSLDASATLTVAVKPHLDRLAHNLGEATGFSVPVGYSVHFLVQAEGPNPVQVRDFSGLIAPMHIGPSGLCMMAYWPTEEVSRYLSRPLDSNTSKTVIDPDGILKRLQFVREHGYFAVEEEYAEGISSLASPVFDQKGRILGAIHMHGPTYRFPKGREQEKVGQAVHEAAQRFSESVNR